jgi:PAT family beta-lactamase induction signal transducer AmpG
VNLAEHRSLRLFTLCALYVAQGIPWGFMAFTLPSYLAAHGLDAAVIGTTLAMTTAPYSFKVIWGPIIDAFPSRRFGRRRPWIVFAQLMMAVTVGAMILIPDLTADVETLGWMIFIHTIFNSMQDVAVDGLAVDLLDEAERGRANGFMYASKWGGGGLGGWGMSKLINHLGLRAALVAQVAVLLAIMLLPLLVRERAAEPEPRAFVVRAIAGWFRRVFGTRPIRTVLGDAVRDRAVQSAVLCAVVMLGSNLAAGTLSAISPVLFTHDLGWSAEDYTSLAAGPGLACGLAGSVLGGLLADKIGHRRLAAIAMVCLAGGYALWAGLQPYWIDRSTVYAMFWIEPFFLGVMTVSLFALCMDVSWMAIAASQFAAYMALSNVSTTFGARYAGLVSETWTYPGIYVVAAATQLALIVVLPFVDQRAAKSGSPNAASKKLQTSARSA